MKKLFYILLLFSCFVNAQCYEKISVGDGHVLVLKSDNTIWGFGSSLAGELTVQPSDYTPIPSSLSNQGDWKDVFGGYLRSFFIKQDGTLWGTGFNSFGCLGINSTLGSTNVMTQIGTANNWLKIATSTTHSVGLKEDGTLWGWGQNNDYELGQGQGNSYLSQLIPIQIGTDNHWMDVTATVAGTLALKNDGTLWGCGQVGVLVNIGQSVYPILTQGQSDNWAKISAGGAFLLAQKNDGTLWAWGQNTYGQLGKGDFVQSFAFPFQISTDTWKDFATGQMRSYGIKTDGTLWAWGRNQEGQLGDGTFENRNIPTQVGSDTNWDRIYAKGNATTVGVKTDGSIWVWGNNIYGEFGNGTLNQGSAVPLQNNILCNLSISNPDAMAFNVSLLPNPAHDQLQFTYNELPNASLEVIDLNGRVVYKTKTIGFNGTLSLPVSHWSRGIYIFKITAENNGIYTEKIVLQ